MRRIATLRTALALAGALALTAAQAQSLLDAPADSAAQKSRVSEMEGPLTFFKSERLISHQTVETTPRGVLSSRVAHRFGNAATKSTNAHTLFGLDQASDIWLGVDYGLLDGWQIGIARAKGAGPLGELWTGSTKLRLPGDRIGSLPIRLAVAANATYSTQTANPFLTTDLPLNEGPFLRRGSYFAQLLAAVSASRTLTIQVAPAFIHRNYVAADDANGLFFLPISTRLRITRWHSLTTEYVPFLGGTGSNYRGGPVFWRGKGGRWFVPFNLGFEAETGGHVFQMSLTNTGGLLENDFLPYNNNDWGLGQWRMGFAIMRGFQIRK